MELLRSRNRALLIRSIQTPTPDTAKLLRETRLAANYLVRDARVKVAIDTMDETVAQLPQMKTMVHPMKNKLDHAIATNEREERFRVAATICNPDMELRGQKTRRRLE